MAARTKLTFAFAALTAGLVTGMTPPARETVFFIAAGAAAGYLSPMGKRWVETVAGRVAGGAALGFLACYARFAPWMGASMPLDLAGLWEVTALAVACKALLLFALMEGVYMRLRQDDVIGA